MGEFLVYIIKVTVFLTIFYIFNKLILSRESFHTINRMVWLLIILASFILPLVGVTNFGNIEKVFIPQNAIDLSQYTIDSGETSDESSLGLAVSVVLSIYVVGALCVLGYKLFMYIRLFKLILPKGNNVLSTDSKNASCPNQKYIDLLEAAKEKLNIDRKIKYIVHEEDSLPPFSWFNYIIISKKDLNEDGETILLHELSHSKSYDSIDIIIADLLIIFQWFNPSSWLVKKEIQQTHEYQADDSVLQTGANAKVYQYLLIKKAIGQHYYTMTNSFNHSNLKKRITMMVKQKSNKWAVAKCLYALPLAFLTVTACGNAQVSANFEKIQEVKVSEFLGSSENTQEQDPQKTKGKEIQIMGERSSYKDKNGDEVLVKIGDDDKPTKFSFPSESDANFLKESYFVDSKEIGDPLIIVDGVVYEGNINDISPKEIESISVLKGEKAVALYGKDGENGVIIIVKK